MPKKKIDREVSNENQIGLYMHCGRCLEEKPDDVTPKDWARVQAGWTPIGLQVWCNRHEANIVHIDFEGARHPANTTAQLPVQVPVHPGKGH